MPDAVLTPDTFDPALFCHGRLFWRHDGSDSARFPPALAWRLVSRAAAGSDGRSVLWDPFCGTALIPCLGRLFFADDFAGIVASDIDPEAVACARRNLAMMQDRAAFGERRRAVEGFRGRNKKSEARWGAVSQYMDRIESLVDAAAHKSCPVTTWSVSAGDQFPEADRVALITDLPYGNASALVGDGLVDIIESVRANPGDLSMDLIATEQQEQELVKRFDDLLTRPIRGGRVQIMWDSRFR